MEHSIVKKRVIFSLAFQKLRLRLEELKVVAD